MMRSRGHRWGIVLLATAMLSCRHGEGDGVVVLRFWGLGREGEVVQELSAGFEREHPGIKVRVQQIPWSAAHEKMLTAHVGDASPDIAQLGNTWISEFVALHALVPLDSSLHQSSQVDSTDYFPGIWRTNAIAGTTYGIPWYVDTRLVFYRKDILRQAGYATFPTNWKEWLEAMRAIKKIVGPARYPIYLPTNEWTQPVVFGMQSGSPLLKDNASYGAFSDSAFRRAFSFYLGIYREGLAPIKGLNDVANPYQEFERGFFAMWITGPWNLGEFARRLPASMQDNWATAPLPGPDGPASGLSTAGGSSLVIFRSSTHQREAWMLLEFLSRPEQQQRFYELTGDLPARTDAWNDSLRSSDPNRHAFWEQLQRVEPTPQVPEWEQIATKVLEYAEQSIRGNVPEDTVLARLDRDVNGLLEKRRWLLERGALASEPRH
ncbi:MAG: sugar ABC transporter substrate-binding protein [Gemmatimonadota bacterium]